MIALLIVSTLSELRIWFKNTFVKESQSIAALFVFWIHLTSKSSLRTFRFLRFSWYSRSLWLRMLLSLTLFSELIRRTLLRSFAVMVSSWTTIWLMHPQHCVLWLLVISVLHTLHFAVNISHLPHRISTIIYLDHGLSCHRDYRPSAIHLEKDT